MKTENVVGKRVLLLADATYAGKIDEVYFDSLCKKIVYFSLDTGMLVPFGEVLKAADVVTVRDSVAFKYPADEDMTALSVALGKDVCSQGGDKLGEVKNICFSSAGEVTRLEVEDSYIRPSRIAAIGDAILLKGDKLPKRDVKMPRPNTDAKVKILADKKHTGTVLYSSDDAQNGQARDENGSEDIPQTAQNANEDERSAQTQTEYAVYKPSSPIALNSGEPQFTENALQTLLAGEALDVTEHTPVRIISDYTFLLGRTLAADLYTYAGELIAPKGAEVTSYTVEAARRAGKLVELTLGSDRRPAK